MKTIRYLADTGGRVVGRLTNPLIAILVMTAVTMGLFSTGCASVKPGNDPVLVNAERAEQIGFDAIDGLLKIETANRAEFAKLVPGATAIADQIRAKTPDAIHAVDRAIDAYKAAKKAGVGTDAATAALNAELAALSSIVQSATDLSAKWTASHHSYLIPPIRGPDAAGGLGGILLGAIALSSILPTIIGLLSAAATFIGGPTAGGLAGSIATALLNMISKISADAEQSAELSDDELAAVRKARDDAFANFPEWQPSTEAPASPADGQ